MSVSCAVTLPLGRSHVNRFPKIAMKESTFFLLSQPFYQSGSMWDFWVSGKSIQTFPLVTLHYYFHCLSGSSLVLPLLIADVWEVYTNNVANRRQQKDWNDIYLPSLLTSCLDLFCAHWLRVIRLAVGTSDRGIKYAGLQLRRQWGGNDICCW